MQMNLRWLSMLEHAPDRKSLPAVAASIFADIKNAEDTGARIGLINAARKLYKEEGLCGPALLTYLVNLAISPSEDVKTGR